MKKGIPGAATKTGGKKADNLFVGECFVEGTPVHTQDGLKPIEEIEIGDLVAAKDEITGEVSWKPVVNLFENENKKVVRVTLVDSSGNEETIGATLEHPFWVDGRG